MKQLNLFGGFDDVVSETPFQQKIDVALQMLHDRPAPNPDSPIVVSYGGGVNSTAMLIAMYAHGIKPDLILFADTAGTDPNRIGEKPETYYYIEEVFNTWLKSVGFPEVTVCRYEPKGTGLRRKLLVESNLGRCKTSEIASLDLWLTVYQNIRQAMVYRSLLEECLVLEGLPNKAYGGGRCSMKWKIEPQRKFLREWVNDKDVEIRQFVGLHAGELNRLLNADGTLKESLHELPGLKLRDEYFLIEKGIHQEHCLALIQSQGLPVPSKSSCIFCPNAKASEALEVKEKHPEVFELICYMEERALQHTHSVKGLGRSFKWSDIGKATPLELAAWDNRQAQRKCGCVD